MAGAGSHRESRRKRDPRAEVGWGEARSYHVQTSSHQSEALELLLGVCPYWWHLSRKRVSSFLFLILYCFCSFSPVCALGPLGIIFYLIEDS